MGDSKSYGDATRLVRRLSTSIRISECMLVFGIARRQAVLHAILCEANRKVAVSRVNLPSQELSLTSALFRACFLPRTSTQRPRLGIRASMTSKVQGRSPHPRFVHIRCL